MQNIWMICWEREEKEKAEKIFTEYLENVQKLHSKKPFSITEEFKNVFGDVPMPGGLTCQMFRILI